MPIVGTTSSLSANAYGLLTAQATVEVNVSGTTINEGDLITIDGFHLHLMNQVSHVYLQ